MQVGDIVEDNGRLDDLVSCKGIINASKFKNFNENSGKYCLNPKAGYTVIGNMDSNEQQTLVIQLRRCKVNATQTCKSETEIDEFVDNLIIT
jgi:hypothetical protein